MKPNSTTALERLAEVVEIPADELRQIARRIATERKFSGLMEKVRLIRSGNTAILPTGEIVARGTPGATPYISGHVDREAMTPTESKAFTGMVAAAVESMGRTCADCIHRSADNTRCLHPSLEDTPEMQLIDPSFAEECDDYDEERSECGHCLGSGKMLDPLDFRRDTSCIECRGSGEGPV